MQVQDWLFTVLIAVVGFTGKEVIRLLRNIKTALEQVINTTVNHETRLEAIEKTVDDHEGRIRQLEK